MYMNQLSTDKRERIVSALVEGCSIASTCRMVGVAKGTVLRYLECFGSFCANYHNLRVRGLDCAFVEADEIWAFVHGREASLTGARRADPELGDTWTWTSICADSKLMIAWHIGDHGRMDAERFLTDLASRIKGRFQLSTDGYRIYRKIVKDLPRDIDYGQVLKAFGIPGGKSANYARGKVIAMDRFAVSGDPEPSRINTSYVERANLTIRMGMRRYTRLTNAQSKKLANLRHAFAIHIVHYNWVRRHGSLGCTPAEAAGLAENPLTIRELVKMHKASERRANSK